MSAAAVFTLFFEFLAGMLLLAIVANVWRGRQSVASWVRTSARIQTFGVSEGAPEVVYKYSVDGVAHTGRAIVPGPLYKQNTAPVKAPKAAYLFPDGSLKFPPGANVDAFYNPGNPADAVLVPGVSPGIGKIAALTLVFALAPLLFNVHAAWFSRHAKELGCGFFFLAGVFLAGYGAVLLRRCLQTFGYPSVTGRLIKADAVYFFGSKKGGYAPEVEFEYTVDGKRYQSRQLTAIPARLLTSKKKAQAQVDQLLLTPEIPVYYNPRIPWEGFLCHGPFWGAALPFVMSAFFMGFGLLAYLSIH